MSKRTLASISEHGIATVMGAGKVRWWPFATGELGAGTGKDKQNAEITRTIISSGGGAIVTALAVSKDSSWLAIARQVAGAKGSSAARGVVSLLRLKGGDGKEITMGGEDGSALPVTLAPVKALHVETIKKGSAVVYIADTEGSLLKWTVTANGVSSQPHLIASELGSVSAVTVASGDIYLAKNEGVNVVKLDASSGSVEEQWPLVRIHY